MNWIMGIRLALRALRVSKLRSTLTVRGIIIGQSISERIRFATADQPNVELREYELSLKLQAVPHLDAKAVTGRPENPLTP